jgi:hypothetical protein
MLLRACAALAAAALLLGGCAVTPQNPVPLAAESVASKSARIGVAMTALPKPTTMFPGANCLLCIGAANIANSALMNHTETLPLEGFDQLPEEVARRIRANGGNAVVIKEPLDVSKLARFESQAPNTARFNFMPLREKFGVDKLVVLHAGIVGMWRTYSAYFPTSEPKATVQGVGYMVNLSNNTYEWYQPVQIFKASDKEWDEPPKFPGLTNAYFQALEQGKDALLKPFQ